MVLSAVSLWTSAQEKDTSTYLLRLTETRLDSIVVISDRGLVEKTIYKRYTDTDKDGSFDIIRMKKLTGNDYYEEFHYASTEDDGIYDKLVYYREVTANDGEELLQAVMHYYQGFKSITSWLAVNLKGIERPLPMRYRVMRCMETRPEKKMSNKKGR